MQETCSIASGLQCMDEPNQQWPIINDAAHMSHGTYRAAKGPVTSLCQQDCQTETPTLLQTLPGFNFSTLPGQLNRSGCLFMSDLGSLAAAL
jgi:hypothetical protein